MEQGQGWGQGSHIDSGTTITVYLLCLSGVSSQEMLKTSEGALRDSVRWLISLYVLLGSVLVDLWGSDQ